jgi:hypothetical protein
MDIGNSVYLVTSRQTTGAGVPAVICGLYERRRASRSSSRKGQKPLRSPCGICFPLGRTRRRSCEFVTWPGKPWIGKGELRARCGKRI